MKVRVVVFIAGSDRVKDIIDANHFSSARDTYKSRAKLQQFAKGGISGKCKRKGRVVRSKVVL